MRRQQLLFIAALTYSSVFAAKDRTWKDGVVMEAGSDRRSEVTGATTTGTVAPTGNVNAETTTQRRTWDENTYIIDAGDRLYMISETIPRMGGGLVSFPVKKGAHLVPGAPVKFAVDRDQLYIQNDTGKERKFHILRVSLKTAPKPNSQ